MPDEDHPRYEQEEEELVEEHSFDELAREVASGILTGSRALKVVSAPH